MTTGLAETPTVNPTSEWLDKSKAEIVDALQKGIRDAIDSISPYPNTDTVERGIVICGGGYRYFTNAYITIRLLRQLGCVLPIELWAVSAEEIPGDLQQIISLHGATVRYPNDKLELSEGPPLPPGCRWQWMLKPYAIIHSAFAEVIYMDSDCFAVRDPTFLLDSPPYKELGAIFWPDYGAMGPERLIWEVMELPYRLEPEFETGQIVIDKRRCWEPLQLTLWMNKEAAMFYQMIWGDKDTFRFAWHKYGCTFAMPPYPVQGLEQPGGGAVVMCQHDFNGNWIFQHRNLAKWDLLGVNPQIPGYMHEVESRQYLNELRKLWNGQIRDQSGVAFVSKNSDGPVAKGILSDLMRDIWLFEDRRPTTEFCCGPEVKWSPARMQYPWKFEGFDSAEITARQMEETSAILRKGLRSSEVSFLKDSVGIGAKKDFYWWTVEPSLNATDFRLKFHGEEGVTGVFERQSDGEWISFATNGEGANGILARLYRVANVYPERTVRKDIGAIDCSQPLHVANHALGIGDAVTGLYAAVGIAKKGISVVYHTRHPEWLQRASHPRVTITSEDPPPGCVDLNADYAEQLRYCRSKARWYGMMALGNPEGQIAAPHLPPARPRLNRAVAGPLLDVSNYVLLAPFAAWQGREWPEGNWSRLAYLLGAAGYEVVAIGRSKESERLAAMFDKSNAYWVLDPSPEWVTGAMLGAQAVIGMDSGMIHVAGLLGVPGVCIHAHLPPEFLFSHAPSITSLVPNTKCRFCRWQPDLGYNDGCVDACSALGTVSPQAVLEAVTSEKITSISRRLQRVVARDSKRLQRRNGPAGQVRVKDETADIIAYTSPPDCGLGEAAAMNIRAFECCGLKVEKRRWEHTITLEAPLKNSRQIYYHHWHPQPHEMVRNLHVAGFNQYSKAFHLAYWAYEAKRSLPREFTEIAPIMTEIWTPSSFCQSIFEDLGVPVHSVPHAVPFLDKIEKLPSMDGKVPFTVLFIFDSWARFARKNPEAVIRVFQKTFASRHDVRLVIKAHHLTNNEMELLKTYCGWDSRITIINKFLNEAELNDLFARSDVLLSLQRGEGFGLNIARALGAGVPVITTAWGGQTEFCNRDNSMLVSYNLCPVDEDPEGPVWAQPNETVAMTMLSKIAKMVAIKDPTLQVMRERGRDLIATEFSEQALQERIATRIKSVLDRIRN